MIWKSQFVKKKDMLLTSLLSGNPGQRFVLSLSCITQLINSIV